jgi:hypothetical protein
VHDFFVKAMSKKTTEEEGKLKNNRNRRHREKLHQFSTYTVEEINELAFLHVPIPTALRPSLSSPSHIFVFCAKTVVQAVGKRKECSRTIGMGGIGKHRTSFPLYC